MKKLHFGLFLTFIAFTLADSKYEDCEKPPEVEYASIVIAYDETEEFVTAKYRCHEGYKLVGKNEITCEFETDEWQGNPPSCESETDDDGDSKSLDNNRKHKKSKVHEIKEENYITSDFAQNLDLSCMSKGLVKAPNITNGYIAKYNRRRKGEKLFLVALYECDDGYELEDLEQNRLYCSQEKWVGTTPRCMYIEEDGDENGDEEDYDDENGNVSGKESEDDESGNGAAEKEHVDNEIPLRTHHRHNENEESTTETTKPHNLTLPCDSDRGGCDHECQMVQFVYDPEPTIQCSCFKGFLLDSVDGRRCHDINECDSDHGCEQICNNLPGSFECRCHPGLQIDTANNKKCIDINECTENPDICSGNVCENSYGTYTCLEPLVTQSPSSTSSSTTIESTSRTEYKEEDEEVDTPGNDADDEESDIEESIREPNEITENSVESENEKVEQEMDNTIETQHHYTKIDIDNDVTETESHSTTEPMITTLTPEIIVISTTDMSNEILGEDESENISVEDKDDERGSDSTEEKEHQIELHHQSSTVKSDLNSKCDDGLRLDENGKCVEVEAVTDDDDDDETVQHKSTNEASRDNNLKPNCQHGDECVCPDGYELSDDESSCQDINECEIYEGDDYDDEGGEDDVNLPKATFCSHTCINLIGSFICSCPENFHIHGDKRTCVRDYCEDLSNESLNKSKCSHQCVDEHNGFACKCPNNFMLQNDMKTCKEDAAIEVERVEDYDDNEVEKSVSIVECSLHDHDKCSPGNCVIDGNNEKECSCPGGFARKSMSCVDLDECEHGTHQCSHSCHNSVGSYHCSCPHGLRLSADDKTCDDFDECSQDNEICGNLECRNTYGSYKCICPDGKEIDEHGKCHTPNLCDNDNGGCSHSCRSHYDEIICECPDDMDLDEDMRTCITSDPCHTENGGCSHFCDSSLKYICYCPEVGYVLDEDSKTCREVFKCEHGFELSMHDNRTCIDIDECSKDPGICLNGKCENKEGSYQCHCHSGYRLSDDVKTCIDFDECSQEVSPCSHRCSNLPGSYQCGCPYGQILIDDHTCGFSDLCDFNNGGCAHECDFVDNKVVCSCRKGYVVDVDDDKNCLDLNECDDNNGGCQQTCINTEGSWSCACHDGYELSRNGFSCIDVDECIENNGNCSNICINLIGSHSCACEAGFVLDIDGHNCIDMDECQQLHDCSHICINTEGSYECDCPVGFTISSGHDKFNCVDVDECLDMPCNNGHCNNTFGSFHCHCSHGYALVDDGKTCADIDECQTHHHQKHDEHHHGCSHLCKNFDGGFSCSCPLGMELSDDERTCQDIDECFLQSPCSHVCENTVGSFICSCPVGYTLDTDQKSCIDIDECLTERHECSEHCINTLGSFHCDCSLSGLVLASDGKTCESPDLCSIDNGGCSHICEMRHNHSSCTCRKGFEIDAGDKSQCNDVNECKRDHNCQQSCVNTIGGFKCECFSGFRLNENDQCIDIDECKISRCPNRSQCINTAGSYNCICPNGFKLSRDMSECIEIKNECKPLKQMKNGQVRCMRSRHKTQLFYRTKCNVTCDKGYKLHGPSIKHCNGTGHWQEQEESICVPLACPRLAKPDRGTILPANCMFGETFAGERCFLHCPSGYKALGKRVAVCNSNLKWQPKAELQCVPVPVKSTISHSTSVTLQAQQNSRPTIKCPEDMKIIKPLNQDTILVRIPKPETNVDWKYVDSQPSWGRMLETTLSIGATEVTFRARSAHTNVFDICRVIIDVIEPTPPSVSFCPEPFVVNLNADETSRPIHWKEPIFESKQPIKQVFKSKIPGHRFSAGVHLITYVATTQEGLSAKCSFRITVKAHEIPIIHQQKTALETNTIVDTYERSPAQKRRHEHLANHESYMMCPYKQPIKIDANYPWNLPRGCVIKNVKVQRNRNRAPDERPLRRQQVRQHQLQQENKVYQRPELDQNEKDNRRHNRLRYYSSWYNRNQNPKVSNNQNYAPAAHWN